MTRCQRRKAFARMPNKDQIINIVIEAIEDEQGSNLKEILLNNRVIENLKIGLMHSIQN